MKYIDTFLDRITMYKVVLYGLVVLAVIAIIFGFSGFIAYSGISLSISLVAILVTCFIVNTAITKVLGIYPNVESVWITGFILFFITFPVESLADLYAVCAVSVFAIASKYVLAVHKKHIWNPVAIALVVMSILGVGINAWWIGSKLFLIPVLVVSFLVVRKVRQFELFIYFALSAVVAAYVFHPLHLGTFVSMVVSGPLIFFGAIMLTEPLTFPPQRWARVAYAIIVGVLYSSHFNLGFITNSPALALVLGNIFSYLVSPKFRLKLTLVQKNQLSPDVYDFVWKSDHQLQFKPGQYLEWTLPGAGSDLRGNRRYFTIASSPTEENIRLGVKFYPSGSTFKNKLLALNTGDIISASSLAGQFVLPKDTTEKMVWIAGGIGITPFRAMAQYMVDANESRDVTLLYSVRTPADLVYKDVFESARGVGVNSLYIVNSLEGESQLPSMRVGMIDTSFIQKEIVDYKTKVFYISGPHGMVSGVSNTLRSIGVPPSQIHTDFFPGLV
jgi:ferredoxin-NADP reductase